MKEIIMNNTLVLFLFLSHNKYSIQISECLVKPTNIDKQLNSIDGFLRKEIRIAFCHCLLLSNTNNVEPVKYIYLNQFTLTEREMELLRQIP